MSRIILFLIIFLGILNAIQIPIYEEKETGATGTAHFSIKVYYDCEKMITIEVADEATNQPIQNAQIFVFYEERYTSLLGSGKTNNEGIYNYSLIGNPQNMKNLFLITFEKSGYRTKEVHFFIPQYCVEIKKEENGANDSVTNKKNDTIDDKTTPSVNEQKSKNEENASIRNNNQTSQNIEETKKEKNDENQIEESKKQFCCISGIVSLLTFAFLLIQNRKRSNHI
ncbi:MAG: hypothetical protein QXF35_00600 [Candidatus Bilamarchaeaceae archaeon]